MNIGTQIKKLRREREITQEELAEYIGISASAVSQWECEKSAPDIVQLPVLAGIFGVSVDELLGVDITKNNEKIDELCEKADELHNGGCRKEAEKMLRAGLLEYPNSYKIMSRLSDVLFLEGNLSEARSLCEKIMEKCTDTDLRYNAQQNLFYISLHLGEKDKAEAIAMTFPEISRDYLLRSVYEGDKLADLYRHYINIDGTDALYAARMLSRLNGDDGKPIYTDDEQIAIAEKIIAGYKLIFEEGDYNFFSQFLHYSHIDLAMLRAKRSDRDATLANLSEALRYGIMFDTYDWDGAKTSLLVRGQKDGGWVKSSPDEKTVLLRELMEDMDTGTFDFVRDDPEFKQILREIKERLK